MAAGAAACTCEDSRARTGCIKLLAAIQERSAVLNPHAVAVGGCALARSFALHANLKAAHGLCRPRLWLCLALPERPACQGSGAEQREAEEAQQARHHATAGDWRCRKCQELFGRTRRGGGAFPPETADSIAKPKVSRHDSPFANNSSNSNNVLSNAPHAPARPRLLRPRQAPVPPSPRLCVCAAAATREMSATGGVHTPEKARLGSQASRPGSAEPRRSVPDGLPFLQRQLEHAEITAERKAALVAAAVPQFAPETNADALLLASPRLKARASETEDERFIRLSVTDASERAEAQTAREEAAQKALEQSFKPAPLSPISQKLAPVGADLTELTTDTRRQQALEAARARAPTQPFSPDTSASRRSRRLLLGAEESAAPTIALNGGEPAAISARLREIMEVCARPTTRVALPESLPAPLPRCWGGLRRMAAAHDAWRWLRDRVASVLSSLTVRGRVFEHRIRLRATRRCSRSTQRRRRRRACALCDGLRLAAHACTRSPGLHLPAQRVHAPAQG